ncbi:hypothetical protein C9890_0318 [Perkinsus sp. BL_2016]|nr:hypothetical protein C9890_0318 [Perkinsus sp. BL_2016]
MAETIPDMDFDTKYGHLTRPLKEAVACWDIDLKEVMESFIAAQDDDVGSMDPSRMLNFAQAGMLVSSTATNYSRKVEHLYTLVYSTLDTMISESFQGNRRNGTGLYVYWVSYNAPSPSAVVTSGGLGR